MKETQKKTTWNLRLSVCFLLNIMLLTSLIQAHHDRMPQGQHVMPNGQIMNADSTLVSQKNTFPIGIWVFLGFLVLLAIGIWFLSKSTRNKTELSFTKFK
jgi:NADH:ubiquinone oxidoreductase subunit 6 (subunit J)